MTARARLRGAKLRKLASEQQDHDVLFLFLARGEDRRRLAGPGRRVGLHDRLQCRRVALPDPASGPAGPDLLRGRRGLTAPAGPDLSQISDPDVRRALRAIYQELHSTIHRQEIEIQAMLEMLLEKHVGSIGEYKRHLTRLQSGGARSSRIHDQVAATLSSQRPHQ